MLQVPEISAPEVVFGQFAHVPPFDSIPEEFQKERSPFCDVAKGWFHGGAEPTENGVIVGKHILTAKEGIDHKSALRAVAAALKSFDPPHEVKIATCGYMLSQWFDLDTQKGG